MSVRVKLPGEPGKPGCVGLVSRMDGTQYRGRPGSTITIDDRHAAEMAISNRTGSDNGLLSLKEGFSFGTRKGRTCSESCSRTTWNVWNDTCPRCGAATVIV